MPYIPGSKDDPYRVIYRGQRDRYQHALDPNEDLWEEGKAIYVSGVGYVPKRRRVVIGGSGEDA